MSLFDTLNDIEDTTPKTMSWEMLRQIKIRGLATGSRVLGGATASSDWDYVLTQRQLIAAANLAGFQLPEIEAGDYDTVNFKMPTPSGDDINVIIAGNDKVKAEWDYATKEYRQLMKEVVGRPTRVAIFQYLRAHYREKNKERTKRERV